MAAIGKLVYDDKIKSMSFGQACLLEYLDRLVPSKLDFSEVMARENPCAWDYRLDQIYDWIDAQNCGVEAA
jgi:hypothetical protein